MNLKKGYIVYLVFLLIFASVSIAKTVPELKNSDVFIELIENTDECLIKCHAVFKVCVPSVDTDIKSSLLTFDYYNSVIEEVNSVKSEIRILRNVTKTVQVPIYGNCRSEKLENESDDVFLPQCVVNYTNSEKVFEEYVKFSDDLLKEGECYIIRIDGQKPINENIDWMPTLEIEDDAIRKIIKHEEWAWWNTSYNLRVPITVSKDSFETTEIVAVTINFTNNPFVNATQLVDNASNPVDYYQWYETADANNLISNATIIFNVSSNQTFYLYYSNNTIQSYTNAQLDWKFLDFNDQDDIDVHTVWNALDAGSSFGIADGALRIVDAAGDGQYRCGAEQCVNISFLNTKTELVTDSGLGLSYTSPAFADSNNHIRIFTYNANSLFQMNVKVTSESSDSAAQAYPQGAITYIQYNRTPTSSVFSAFDLTNSHELTVTKDGSTLQTANLTLDSRQATTDWEYICMNCFYNDSDRVSAIVGGETGSQFLSISASPTPTYPGNQINITINILDHLGITNSWINVTLPNGSVLNYSYSFTNRSNFSTSLIFNNTVQLGTYTALGYYNNTTNSIIQASTTFLTNFTLTNCSGGETESYRFTFFDELNRTNITGNMSVAFTLPGALPEANETRLTFRFENNYTYPVCIDPANASYVGITIEATYDAIGFGPRFFKVTNVTMSNVSQNVSLYLLPTIEGQTINFQVRDMATNLLVPGAIIQIQRRYLEDEDTYIWVATVETGVDGVGSTFVDTENVIYRFVVILDNQQIFEYAPSTIVSNPTELQIGYTLFGDWDSLGTISSSCYFTGVDNKTVSCTAIESTGADMRVCLRTYDYDAWDRIEICDSCTSGSATITMTCNATAANNSIKYTFSYEYGDLIQILQEGIQDLLASASSLGTDGAMVAFFTVITVGVLGALMHPIIGFVLSIVGFLMLDLMNIFDMPPDVYGPLVLIMAIVSILMARKEGIL